MNVILCGLPMCGKSTIGKIVANKLQRNFVDNDQNIERVYTAKTGKNYTCRQIVIHEGEPLFRKLEHEQIVALQTVKLSVISLGGGVCSCQENLDILKSIGFLIYIKESVSTLWKRTQQCGIPSYLDQNNPKEDFRKMTSFRIPIYEAVANLTIDAENRSPDEVAELIIKSVKHGQ